MRTTTFKTHPRSRDAQHALRDVVRRGRTVPSSLFSICSAIPQRLQTRVWKRDDNQPEPSRCAIRDGRPASAALSLHDVGRFPVARPRRHGGAINLVAFSSSSQPYERPSGETGGTRGAPLFMLGSKDFSFRLVDFPKHQTYFGLLRTVGDHGRP